MTGRAESGERTLLAAGQGIRAALADLFPEPAEPAKAPLARWAIAALQVAVAAAGAAVMLARVGGRPPWDSAYAEDPGIYLPWAIGHPWHLLESYGGYLQLVPRVIGQVAALLPVRHAFVAFAVGGALVASGCALFTYYASAGHVSSRWARVLLGLSVVLLPVAQLEIADNGANSIWYLLVALFWATLWRPRTRSGAAVAAVVAFTAATSSSLALLFAPMFAARALVVPRRPRDQGPTIGWALGSLVQVLVMLSSHVSRFSLHRASDGVLYYSHDVLLPALGWHLSWWLRGAVGLTVATALAGGFIVVVLAGVLVTQDRQCKMFVGTAVATGLVFTAVTAALAWGGPHQLDTVTVERGARYSTVPILLLDAALIVAADACARRRWPLPRLAVAAVAALVVVLGVGWATDFRYPVRHDAGAASAWKWTADAWLRHCRHKPDGTITVGFRNWWGRTPPRLTTTFSCTQLRR